MRAGDNHTRISLLNVISGPPVDKKSHKNKDLLETVRRMPLLAECSTSLSAIAAFNWKISHFACFLCTICFALDSHLARTGQHWAALGGS